MKESVVALHRLCDAAPVQGEIKQAFVSYFQLISSLRGYRNFFFGHVPFPTDLFLDSLMAASSKRLEFHVEFEAVQRHHNEVMFDGYICLNECSGHFDWIFRSSIINPTKLEFIKECFNG
jgi:hypothetical protein